MGTKFTDNDLKQLQQRGISAADVERQLANFEHGFPYLAIEAEATIGNGILHLDGSTQEYLINIYHSYLTKRHKIVKFVPASGAATRMFKDLYEFLSSGKPNRISEEVIAEREHFAFDSELERLLPETPKAKDILEYIVSDKGLDYGTLPKALILFHRYHTETRTPIEEHLTEGAQYAASAGKAHLHFTISPEHRSEVRELLKIAIPKYEHRFKIKYDVSLSEQKPATDTIAVNMDNTPFRNDDGTLLFRPAGHGALIDNLNELDADIVFIKNIDNVTTDNRRRETIHSKQALAGLLVELQAEAFRLLRENASVDKMVHFLTEKLMVKGVDKHNARKLLNRPIRICGMVRNEGEPGGGPFWVKNEDGTQQLQIAESSQIAPEKRDVMSRSTHFNPVDLVCGLKNYKGEKFDLREFTDPLTGFISEKSKDGQALKAQELPGLWNGAMASWNTIFVEVPPSTFTPVKVVTDLLRKEHQQL